MDSATANTTGCPVAHTAAGFSFFGREYQENPGASLAWARESRPVFYNEDSGYWVVTRHEDVKSIFSRFNDFSAAITLEPVTPPSAEAGAQLGKYDFAPCPVLVDSDAPMHRKYRRLNAPAFMPDRIEPLAPYIRQTTNAYLDRFIDRGHADLIADLLWDIPCLVALQFLGIPEEDVDTVRELATSMTEFVWGRPSPEEQVRAADGLGRFWAMGERVIAKLKELDDPPGWLGHAIKMQRENPDVISDTWLQTNVMGGAMAAHETTTNATANAIVTLLRNRDQWDRLCADPTLIPAAVEECLRLNPSVAAWRRLAKEDVRVGDVTIPAGGKILMVIASANQDGSVFDEPERFDIDRDDAGAHIAFGTGTHMCLGNHLARLEMVIYLEELTRRLPHLTLDEQEFHYVPNTSFRGPEALHVSWDVAKNPGRSGSVAGREIVFTNAHGSRVWHRFGATTVDWGYEPGAGDPHPAVSGRDDYAAFDVAEGLVYTQFHHRADVPNAAVSLVLDFEHGRSLAVVSTIDEPGEGPVRVRHTFLPGLIEGLETSGSEAAPTSTGPAVDVADTVECTTYGIRPGISVVAARETTRPRATVTVADHRAAASPKTYGAVFGLDETGGPRTHFTFTAAGVPVRTR